MFYTIDEDLNVVARERELVTSEMDDPNLLAFTTQDELLRATATWPAKKLVCLWNAFAGVPPFGDLEPVKKFETRNSAVTRIWKAVQKLAARSEAPGEAPGEAEPTTAPAPKRVTAKRVTPAVVRSVTASARGNKRGLALEAMKREGGATVTEIMEAATCSRGVAGNLIDYWKKKQSVQVIKAEDGMRRYAA